MKLIKGSLVCGLIVLLTACAASTPAGVGVWDVEMNTPLGAQAMVLTLNGDGTGSMAGPQGTQSFDGVTYDGNVVAFSASIDAQGQSITLEFSGNVTGDAIDGEFGTPFGALAVSGTRQ